MTLDKLPVGGSGVIAAVGGEGALRCRLLDMGLIPKTRLYVHLSGDYDTARKVGARHGSPRVYQINAARMAADGYVFYRSVNGVWLTKAVPTLYLTRMW